MGLGWARVQEDLGLLEGGGVVCWMTDCSGLSILKSMWAPTLNPKPFETARLHDWGCGRVDP